MTEKIEIEYLNMVCIMLPVVWLQASVSINYELLSNIIEGRKPSYMKNVANDYRSTIHGCKA
jgi:hypothetical protein